MVAQYHVAGGGTDRVASMSYFLASCRAKVGGTGSWPARVLS